MVWRQMYWLYDLDKIDYELDSKQAVDNFSVRMFENLYFYVNTRIFTLILYDK